jgi:putative peptide zinc metalloprotease protein
MEGSVQSVTASAGEYVQKDDLLLRLENEPLRDEAIVLETQLAAIIAEQNAARAREDFATFASSQQRQASLRRELSEVQRRIEKLSIYAPVSGWVVSAPRRPRISSTKINEPLPLWSGTPLNPKNLGAFLPVQTQVCTIAGQPNFDAVLLVRQDDYQHISVGSQVRIAFEHLPGHVVTTRVEKESSRTIEYCPASLSNKFGGPIATIQMPDGRERLLESLIPFSVKLPDSESQLLRHELRGAARIVIADYSIAGWIKRKALSTLRFRM